MLKTHFMTKSLLPIGIVLVAAGALFALSATGVQSASQVPSKVQTTNVSIAPLEPTRHQTMLKGFGEIVPYEISQLSTRVSGNVVSWSQQFVAGGLIAKDQVLFKLEDSRYQAGLKSAEAELLSAKAELERELGLAKVAKSELERFNSSDRNSLFLREPQINSAYAAVKSAEAGVILAKTNLEATVIRAPFNALVVERNLGLGQFVAEGTPVAVLYNTDKAEVVVPMAKFDRQFLPEDFAATKVKVSIVGSDFSLTGVLSRVLNLTDSQTRSDQIVVSLQDLYQGGKPPLQFGDYVEVEFAGKTLEQVYRVPEGLLSQNQLWVVEQQQLQRKPVSVVRHEAGYALVRGNFGVNDKLVQTVPEYPYQGMPVTTFAAEFAGQVKNSL